MSRRAELIAGVAVLIYVAAIAVRPLNANDLFWHLATGREILTRGSIPRTDPFSFASDGGPWIDHEWLWQIGAQMVYEKASGGRGPGPDGTGDLALILGGAAIVVAAFALGLRALISARVPAGVIVALGLMAAEIARPRMMVRPESASLLLLALLLLVLARGRPRFRRGALLAAITTLWANIHPAALLAPVIILVYGIGGRLSEEGSSARVGTRAPGAEGPAEVAFKSSAPRHPSGFGALLIEAALAGVATLFNPYGWRLWTVPFALSSLVKRESFYNPEWLRPPPGTFPLFYIGAALVVAAVVGEWVRSRRGPSGAVLATAFLAVLGLQQMRHMGLFAIALLFAAPAMWRSLGAGRSFTELLGRPVVATLALAGAVIGAGAAFRGTWRSHPELGLDPQRFPVAACEEIAAKAPGLRLYNDVQFGGYLIWRFFPGQKVFIDGRNELYARLLPRLAGIHTGEVPYEDWRALIKELAIEGAIVRYADGKKGVLYPPLHEGEPPVKGYRAWSAFLFPRPEWSLVYFDDTALVFMRRGERGEAWASLGEYRDYNPEDEDYLLERAAKDPALAERLRGEALRRVKASPPCLRAAEFLRALER